MGTNKPAACKQSVTVIATVYNEGENIRRLLDSLAAQTRLPDEIVFCDGGSQDHTVAIIQEMGQTNPESLPNLQVLVADGANISRGRNVAIAAAVGPIIAATDAGVRLDPKWLEALMAPFDAHSIIAGPTNGQDRPIAVAGFFVPDVEGAFQTAMAATVLPLLADIRPDRFLPSSRSVAFTKAAWQEAGGYPEWLDYCEDLIFDFAVNAQQPERPSAFVFAPEAVAYFQPRTDIVGFWRQYYRYARGDGKADLWRKRHIARYITYLLALPVLLWLAWGGGSGWIQGLGWLGLSIGVVLYCGRPWQRLWQLGHEALTLRAMVQGFFLVPVIRVVGDLAKMFGYPAGLLWRWRNRNRPEIHWRNTIRHQS